MRSRRSLGLLGVFAAGSEPRSGDPDFVIATGAGSGSNDVSASRMYLAQLMRFAWMHLIDLRFCCSSC
ncbi:hypothetical protein Plhal703r1_c42g0141771 [Plasmopara halstedii]